MTFEEILALREALAKLLPEGFMGLVQRIEPGNEALLSAGELLQLAPSVRKVRDASGTARHLARKLCRELGVTASQILRDPKGVPIWPQNVLGSMSHDDDVAVAVVGRIGGLVRGIGVDVEAPVPLDETLIQHALTPIEQERLLHSGLSAKAAFSIKEAVFKAVFPTGRKFLEFDQIVLDPQSQSATTACGRTVRWSATMTPRILGVAWW